jgi:hypothetical protein
MSELSSTEHQIQESYIWTIKVMLLDFDRPLTRGLQEPLAHLCSRSAVSISFFPAAKPRTGCVDSAHHEGYFCPEEYTELTCSSQGVSH